MTDRIIILKTDFLDGEYWNEERYFSRAEAWIDLISNANPKTFKLKESKSHFQKKWKWSEEKFIGFISDLRTKGLVLVNDEQNVIYINNLGRYVNKYDTSSKKKGIPTSINKPFSSYRDRKFTDINDLSKELKECPDNESYLFIAYRFWEVWYKHHPTKTLTSATIAVWSQAIQSIIEIDKQSTDRLIALLEFFKMCSADEPGYDKFWFDTIKSVVSFRKKNNEGVYYLDSIMERVNKKVEVDKFFRSHVQKQITKFNEYKKSILSKNEIHQSDKGIQGDTENNEE